MVTKLTAARIATAAGCCLVICTSSKPEGILEILGGARQGTKFFPLQRSLKGRKRWLLTGVGYGSVGFSGDELKVQSAAEVARDYGVQGCGDHGMAGLWGSGFSRLPLVWEVTHRTTSAALVPYQVAAPCFTLALLC